MGRYAATLLLLIWMLTLTNGKRARLIAQGEATAAAKAATVAAPPPGRSHPRSRRFSDGAGDVIKILEASGEHRRMIKLNLLDRTTDAVAPTPAVGGSSRSAGGGRGPGNAAPPSTAADHVTKDIWERLPDWLPTKVRDEFLKDNALFLRRRSGAGPGDGILSSTAQPTTADHITKDIWERLPDWLPTKVRDEFLKDNALFLRRRSGSADGITTDIPTGAAPTTTTQQDLPPWLVELLSKSPAPSTEATTNPPASAPTPAVTAAPTRPPLTLGPSERLPPKCARQLNWQGQAKCSASRSKWTFNPASRACEWFAFYGCRLNCGNIFNSRRDCESYCIRGVVDPCQAALCAPVYTLYQSECFLLNDTACIGSYLEKYRQIASPAVRMQLAREEIDLFCQPPVARCRNTGINVRLPTYESPPTFEAVSDQPPRCHLPPDRGSCQPGQRPRMSGKYYFSQRHNQCKFLMHFGCGSIHQGANLFDNQAECYRNCGI